MSPTEPRILDCEAALRRLAEYLDRELDDAAGAELEDHLEKCRSCYSRAEFERGLRQRIGELRDAPVRPEFEQRICALARSFGTS